jgi:hypothetical protein
MLRLLAGSTGYSAIVRGVAAALMVSIVACVGPARDFPTYEGKAKESAKAALSAVETARVSVLLSSRGDVFGPYVSVLLTEAEEDAGSVQATFDSIQPPDARSDALKRELDRLLARAVTSLTELRIASRRVDVDALSHLGRPLSGIAAELEQFVAAQS